MQKVSCTDCIGKTVILITKFEQIHIRGILQANIICLQDASYSSFGVASGSVKVNSVPAPSVLVTLIVSL